MSGEVWEVWGAYHERERLCPEGVRVREIAHVHYDKVKPTRLALPARPRDEHNLACEIRITELPLNSTQSSRIPQSSLDGEGRHPWSNPVPNRRVPP